MLHTSYGFLGIALVVLTVGLWVIKSHRRHRCAGGGDRDFREKTDLMGHNHDVEHQVLMFLMSQKTDAMLAALARTIEQERQKLGGIVRNPSMSAAIDAFGANTGSHTGRPRKAYDQIQPLVRSGMTVTAISRQLRLPEDEISMVMRRHAA